ncbi:MAG: hypothetical protein WBW84_06990 [Acidobacteriaceae bacterium]
MAMSLRNLSLGVATASFLLAGSAMAQTSQPMQSTHGSSAQLQQWQMKGVNARLDHTLDAQSAHRGEAVSARLDRSLQLANGTNIPGGTQIWGKVEKVQASQNGGPSSVTLRFTKAEVNNRAVPVKVTVIGAYPTSARSSYMSMGDTLPPPPQHINSKDKYMQEPGMLKHVEMKSAVQGHNSATFIDQNGNLKLSRGTYLQLAIAARNNPSQQRSGL